MKRSSKIVAAALALAFTAPITWAQTAPAPAKPDTDTVKTFYLTNVSRVEDANELTAALRNLLDAQDKMVFVPSQNAIVLRAAPDQIELAQRLLKDLDRLKRTYRLTYTLTELDGGKRVGSQHFAMIVVAGGRTVLKQGSKVPIVTGAYNPGTSSQNTQVTYLDVGLNTDASLDEFVDGVRLRTKIEKSSVAEETSGLGTQDPVIRQTLLEGTSILTLGKPIMLGSLDIPGTTRHLDVEVVLEVVK